MASSPAVPTPGLARATAPHLGAATALCPRAAQQPCSLLCRAGQSRRGSFSSQSTEQSPCQRPRSLAGRGSQVPAALPTAAGQRDTGTNGLNQPVSAWEKSCNNFQLRTNICSQVINSWKMLTDPLLQQREQVPRNECAE